MLSYDLNIPFNQVQSSINHNGIVKSSKFKTPFLLSLIKNIFIKSNAF